ncbi:MAG: hypothetical protein WC829_02385 [Hyphomicrobium sp.]|jgi:hypothetical protein
MNKYEAELIEANSLLRSAFAIAEREGAVTNWGPFTRNVHAALERQLPMVNALKAGDGAFLVTIDGDLVRDLQGNVVGTVSHATHAPGRPAIVPGPPDGPGIPPQPFG